jgi:hypothetical protein
MRYFLAILVVALLVLTGGYLLLLKQQPESPDATAPASTDTATPSTPRPAEATVSAPAAPGPEGEALDREARAYIRDLTAVRPQPLPADDVDHFVQSDQPIRLLAETRFEETTTSALLADPAIQPETPIAVVKEVDQIEVVTIERLLARTGQDLEQTVKVIEGDEIRETTVRELAESHPDAPQTPVTLVRKVEEVQMTTAGAIATENGDAGDEPIRVARGRQLLDQATVAELMPPQAGTGDGIYYVHTVRDTDEQGIWGIIQRGLTENFARGIAIRRGEDIGTYQVDIPASADEMVSDRQSSFLGQMIYDKSQNTFVYNFEHGRMGHNPDLIHPGQELLIVRFSTDELIAIYKHFVNNRS